MAVPEFETFLLPTLRATADGREYATDDLNLAVSRALRLSPADLEEMLPRGTQTRFRNRVAWATVYLSKAGLLERKRRGVFAITRRGQELLREGPVRIRVKDLYDRYAEFREFKKGGLKARPPTAQVKAEERSLTPEEELEATFLEIERSLVDDVVEALKGCSPGRFEQIVVDLLVAMGYGFSVPDSGRVVGGPHDEGIDGIIKQDKLGLDVVYIQAKRWATPVGRSVVQAFAGSLEGHRAQKGVLITTSTFSQDARQYVQAIGKKIVLIDGNELAKLLIDHNVGVASVPRCTIKRLERKYFEED